MAHDPQRAGRLGDARARLDRAKRGLAFGAAAAFVVALPLARASHPDNATATTPASSTPAASTTNQAGTTSDLFGTPQVQPDVTTSDGSGSAWTPTPQAPSHSS
jgi:hypothetical protein